MKSVHFGFTLILFMLFLALPASVLASPAQDILTSRSVDVALKHPNVLQQKPNGDKFVLGDSYTLRSGETIVGNLVVMAGTAMLQEGSIVEGDVALMGGTLFAAGLIEGDVVVIGGFVNLRDTAVLEGDLTTISSNLEKEEGAVIEGDILENAQTVFPLAFMERFQIPTPDGSSPIIIPGNVQAPPIGVHINNPLWDFLRLLFSSIILALLAVLVVLFLPQPIGRITGVAVSQPLPAGGLGCLTAIIAPLLIVILTITICGIPVAIVISVVLLAGWVLGMVALGLEVGTRLARLLNRDWALPVNAALGVFILTLVANTIGEIVPCVGWLVPMLLGAVGLGAVLLTYFGAKDYPPPLTSALVQADVVHNQPPSDPAWHDQEAGEVIQELDEMDELGNSDVETPGKQPTS